MTARIAERFLARPRLAIAAWATAVVVLLGTGAFAGGELSPISLLVPGGGAHQASTLNEQRFGSGATDIAILLTGRSVELDRRGPLVARQLRRLPGLTVASPWDRDASAEVLRPQPDARLLAVSYPQRDAEEREQIQTRIEHAVATSAGSRLQTAMTGPSIIGDALQDSALDAVAQAELIALPALLIALLLVFRSLIAAAIPILFGASVVAAGHGAISLIAGLADINAFAVTLVSLVGLALGVDYSLLMVSRYREELRTDHDPRGAALRAAEHAGHTIIVASIALAAALAAALVLAPGGILLSTVAGSLTAAGLAALGATVVMPALLALLGARVNAFALGARSTDRQPSRRTPFALLSGRPLLTVLLAAGALVALALPALTLRTGPPDVSQLPSGDSARKATEAVTHAAGAGWTSPFVLLASGPPHHFSTRATRRAVDTWAARLRRVPGVRAVAVQPNADASALRITVLGPAGPNATATRQLHDRLKARAPDLRRTTDATVAVGGQPAEFREFRDALSHRAPWLIAAMVLTTALILALVFRSVVLPIVAVTLNLLAVGAAFGAVTLLFSGSNPPLGGPGFVDAISIIAAFTIVFGLSVDYQVFIVARMREHYRACGNAHAAITNALTHTATIVTGAAAIMIAVFVAFALAPMVAIRQLGTALAIAVAIDATIVRLMLLPATARILGDHLWWWPARRPSRAPTGRPAPHESAG